MTKGKKSPRQKKEPRKTRDEHYEKKVAINSTLDEVLSVMVSKPNPELKKRKGNQKK